MIRIPAHKQTDPMKKPGQAINPVKTLGEYVNKVVAAEAALKKLTFDEWYVTIRPKNGGMPWDDWFVCMREAWCAGQENT